MKRTRIQLSEKNNVIVEHLVSGQSFDLKLAADEQKGFSPLDLLGLATGIDMVSRIADFAERNEAQIGDISVEISQMNQTSPNALSELHVALTFADSELSKTDKSLIETLALNGPVSNSIHPNIRLNVRFNYS